VNQINLEAARANYLKQWEFDAQEGVKIAIIILTLRGEKLYEIPSSYILRRWEERCKR
jgi:hypothetical protein